MAVPAGYGITLLPEICADVEVRDDRVDLFRFQEPQPARTVGLDLPADRQRPVDRHIDFAVVRCDAGDVVDDGDRHTASLLVEEDVADATDDAARAAMTEKLEHLRAVEKAL